MFLTEALRLKPTTKLVRHVPAGIVVALLNEGRYQQTQSGTTTGIVHYDQNLSDAPTHTTLAYLRSTSGVPSNISEIAHCACRLYLRNQSGALGAPEKWSRRCLPVYQRRKPLPVHTCMCKPTSTRQACNLTPLVEVSGLRNSLYTQQHRKSVLREGDGHRLPPPVPRLQSNEELAHVLAPHKGSLRDTAAQGNTCLLPYTRPFNVGPIFSRCIFWSLALGPNKFTFTRLFGP